MEPINEKALLQSEAREFFTRPFNLEHAKAGAPYACRDGSEATILKWDGRRDHFPLVGVYGPHDLPNAWAVNGSYGNHLREHLDLVMLPLGYIEGEPVFVDDKIINAYGAEVTARPFSRDFDDCRWPAPAKVYLETRMTDHELFTVYNAVGDGKPLRRIANAALRHAIDAGQVVVPDDAAPTKEAYDQCNHDLGKAERLLESLGYRTMNGEWVNCLGPAQYSYTIDGVGTIRGSDLTIKHVLAAIQDRAARDMKIASAVRMACEKELAEKQFSFPVLNVDLAAIIAKVQP